MFVLMLFFFFFKQKTAYEMRISDWSSDVCSSDLCRGGHCHRRGHRQRGLAMKDAASTAQREQNQRQGLIVGTITLPFRLLGVLIGSLLFSIVVECIGMHLFWKEDRKSAV